VALRTEKPQGSRDRKRRQEGFFPVGSGYELRL